jgi:putative flippase GtrA
MQNLIRQFTGKEHTPLVQFIKYGIAGGIATAVHISAFYVAAGYLLPALTGDDLAVRLLRLPAVELSDVVRARYTVIDNFLAFVISNFVCYVINVKWVFEGGRHRRSVEIALFYAVSGTSVAVGSGIAWVLVRAVGLTTTVAFGANVAASILINYVLRKFVVFKG